MNEPKHRSPFVLVGRLIVLVKPMLPIMLAAIVMGVAGHFCATFITIFGGFVCGNVLHTLLTQYINGARHIGFSHGTLCLLDFYVCQFYFRHFRIDLKRGSECQLRFRILSFNRFYIRRADDLEFLFNCFFGKLFTHLVVQGFPFGLLTIHLFDARHRYMTWTKTRYFHGFSHLFQTFVRGRIHLRGAHGEVKGACE